MMIYLWLLVWGLIIAILLMIYFELRERKSKRRIKELEGDNERLLQGNKKTLIFYEERIKSIRADNNKELDALEELHKQHISRYQDEAIKFKREQDLLLAVAKEHEYLKKIKFKVMVENYEPDVIVRGLQGNIDRLLEENEYLQDILEQYIIRDFRSIKKKKKSGSFNVSRLRKFIMK